MAVELHQISKTFHQQQVLSSIDLTIANGEFLTILGPSGCGKTTLLRLLSGFEQPDQGKIILQQKDITHIPPEGRHINMVFQSYALFPHMTVFENVAFGLRCQRSIPSNEIEERVMEVLTRVKLQELVHRKPHSLSGGQKQRVAIARAVVNQPLVLLLDEPLSALDYHLRKSMQLELKQLQKRLGITFILVTHDQEEALSISDRVVVMNHGTIEQIGTPRIIYEKPSNLFVAKFVGETIIFTCEVLEATETTITVNIENKSFILKNKKNFKVHNKILVVIRPEDVTVYDQNEVEDTSDMVACSVEQVIYKGSTVDLIVTLPSGKRIAATEFFDEDDEDLAYEVGQTAWAYWVSGWEVILPYEESQLL